MDKEFKEKLVKLLVLRYQAKYGTIGENLKEYRKLKKEIFRNK